MFEAANRQQLPPRRISFTGTLKILRSRLSECPPSRAGRERWYNAVLAEIAEETLPVRDHRINPRVIKRKMSKWAKKKPDDRNYPQPRKDFRSSLVLVR